MADITELAAVKAASPGPATTSAIENYLLVPSICAAQLHALVMMLGENLQHDSGSPERNLQLDHLMGLAENLAGMLVTTLTAADGGVA